MREPYMGMFFFTTGGEHVGYHVGPKAHWRHSGHSADHRNSGEYSQPSKVKDSKRCFP